MEEKRVGPGTSTGAVEEFPNDETSKQTAYSGEGPALVKYAPENSPATTSVAGAPPEAKARRSGRMSRQIAILLFGSDADGRVFTEETHTVVLSLHGAGIVSRQRLIPEQELVLRCVEKRREAEVRVVGEIAQQDGLHTYGVAFVSEDLDFWEVEFPEAAGRLGQPERFLLECGRCHELEELANGDFEYDICTIHGGLTRYCRECGLLTVWRKSERTKPIASTRIEKKSAVEGERAYVAEAIEPVKVEDFLLPIAEPATAKEVERRARPRAKVNFFGCVRSEGSTVGMTVHLLAPAVLEVSDSLLRAGSPCATGVDTLAAWKI